MRKFLLLLVLISFVNFAQESNQKSVSVTVYNNDLGVIKDVRELDLKKGSGKIEIKDVAEFIDPTSVHIKFDGEVVEQNYQYDLANLERILQKYIDKEIQLINDKGELIEGKLISLSGMNLVLQKRDGGLTMIPNLNEYRINVTSLPAGFITKPALVWKVNTNKNGKQEAELSYMTGGMNWHCEYVALVNENDTKLGLNAWVSVTNNSGASYNNAKLKLVAGEVNRVQDNIRNRPTEVYMQKSMEVDAFVEQSFFEYHIYDLERPADILNRETKQISLFEADGINVKKSFRYIAQENVENKVDVVLEFENRADNNLGRPLPAGRVRVYKSDGKANEFIGEESINHTAKNEKVKVSIGKAFDVVGETKLMDEKRISDRVIDRTYEIKVRNRKTEDIVVEVVKSFYQGAGFEILESSIPFEKESAYVYKFSVPVKADKETTLKIKTRQSW